MIDFLDAQRDRRLCTLFLFTRVKAAGYQVSHEHQEAMVGFQIDERRFVLDEYNSRGERMA
jgi:hypothetical protein